MTDTTSTTSTTAPDGAQDDGAVTEASAEREQPAREPEQTQPAREPDVLLAGAREVALSALKELVHEQDIGEGHRVVADDELLVTHFFDSARRGYRDWQWYVTLARVPGSEQPTVCESGMLPGQGALLAPEWVPWSQRVRDSDHEDCHEDAEPADAAIMGEEGESEDEQAQHPDDAPDGDEPAGSRAPGSAGSAESSDSADSDASAASADSADEAADGPEDADERPQAQPPRRVDAAE